MQETHMYTQEVMKQTYCKMSLKSFRSSVSEIPTNLTSVADIEAMKSVEPVRDRLKEK